MVACQKERTVLPENDSFQIQNHFITTLQVEDTQMPDDQPRCLKCQRSSSDVPLLLLKYQGREYWICAQDLPILIHKPENLSEQLPGANLFSLGESHEHH
jgi:hypothetical protein